MAKAHVFDPANIIGGDTIIHHNRPSEAELERQRVQREQDEIAAWAADPWSRQGQRPPQPTPSFQHLAVHLFAIEFRIRGPFGDVREVDMLPLDVTMPANWFGGSMSVAFPLTLHTSMGDRGIEWRP